MRSPEKIARDLESLAQEIRESRFANTDPVPWYTTAMADVGVVEEIPGREAHPRIALALSHTRHPSRSDETAWCSAYVCLLMSECGLPHTSSAAARSWLDYGKPCELKRGAIAVLWRKRPSSRSGHVGIVHSWDDTSVTLVGGNQGNAVSIKSYPRARLLDTRMPLDVS